MARERRGESPAGIYHVTSRGNRRQLIFLESRDFQMFLGITSDVVRRKGWNVHAYCLMPNHYHLVVKTGDADLSAGMHRVNSRYAHWFNSRHDLDGHLFQGRFHSASVESDSHLIELHRYLALNPVRAGLCSHPGAWRWSSFGELAGLADTVLVSSERVLRHFGAGERAREVYRGFVWS